MRKTCICLLFVQSLLLQGCLFRESPVCYGVDFNFTRETLGINLLDSGWRIGHTEPYYTRWINPSIDKTKVQYIMKQVCYFDNILSMEMDVYENVNTGILTSERLAIMFYYLSSRYDEKNIFHRKENDILGWDFRYTRDDGHESVQTELISKQQADSIIKVWGIEK